MRRPASTAPSRGSSRGVARSCGRSLTLQRVLIEVLLTQAVFLMPSCAYPILPAHLTLRSDDDDHYMGQSKPSRFAARMRPSPSDDLPVEPPVFPFDNQLLPTAADLSPHKLSKMLGPDYDPAFMSSVRPLESINNPNGTLSYDLKRANKLNNLPQDIKDFNLSVPGRRRRLKLKSQKTRRRVLRFLSLYGQCPVHYKWKDLGPRFWPRWIREGNCYNGRSCSIPAGMACKAIQSESKTVLWWHCPKRRHKACRWISIKYPIITRCTCSC